jgi:hypothetical protein
MSSHGAVSSNVQILSIEYPVNYKRALARREPIEQAVQIRDPDSWLRTLVHQHTQAQRDLQQLYEACGQHFDRDDHRIRAIERNYQVLFEGTRYVYKVAQQGATASRDWLQTQLTNTANTYQTFQQDVWQAIIEKTQAADQVMQYQQIQIICMQDAIVFLHEVSLAWNENLERFRQKVTQWAYGQNVTTAELAAGLAAVRTDVQQLAAQTPLPVSPSQPTYLQGPPPRRTRPTAATVTAGAGGSGNRPPSPPTRWPVGGFSRSSSSNSDDEPPRSHERPARGAGRRGATFAEEIVAAVMAAQAGLQP